MDSSSSFTSNDVLGWLSHFAQIFTGQFERLNRNLEATLQQQETQRRLLDDIVRNQQQQKHHVEIDSERHPVSSNGELSEKHVEINEVGMQQDHGPPEVGEIVDPIDDILQALEDPETTANRRREVAQQFFSIELNDHYQDPKTPVEVQNVENRDPSPDITVEEEELFIPEDFEPPTFEELMDLYDEAFEETSTSKAVKRLGEVALSDFFNEDGDLLDSLPKPPRKKRRKTKRSLGASILRAQQQQGSGAESTSRNDQETPRPIFQISNVRQLAPRHNKRFNTKEIDVVMTVRHNLRDFAGNIMQAGDELDAFYENLMQPYLDELQSPDDYYSFICTFKNAYPIQLFGKKKMFDRTQFTNTLYNMAQSNTAFQLDGGLGIRIGLIPAGHIGTSSALRQRGLSSDKRAHHSRNIITIKNKDNLCGWRALAVGLWRAENPKDSEFPKLPTEPQEEGQIRINNRLGDDFLTRWRRTRDAKYRHQKEAAELLMRDLGVELGVPMTSEHYPIIAEYLETRDIQFIVMSTIGPSPLYKNEYKDKFVGLLYTPGDTQYNPGHYDVFLDLKAVYCTGLACRKCWKVTNSNLWVNHLCFVCDACLTKHDEDDGSGVPVKCTECYRTFKNQVCYDNHKNGTDWSNKRKRTPTCKMIKYCESCEIEYQTRGGVHECGLFKCHVCSEKYTDTPHYCHIKPLDKEALQKEDGKLKIIVCFDIESVIDSEHGYTHKPVLLKAQTTCQACWDNTTNSYKSNADDGSDVDCPNCQAHYLSFEGPGCVADFVNYIFDVLAPIKPKPNQKRVKCHEIYVFAHNSRAYDGIFVISEILKMNKLKPSVIANGLKIVKLKVGSVRFLDTLYLFPMSLAALPAAFGIEDKSKGRFPYNLLTMENYNSEEPQPLPPLSAFEPDKLKEKDKKGLSDWYNARTALNEPYVFKHELHTYCANDVEILLKVLMKFRQLFKSITGIDPITRKFTLASIAMESFRANNLGEHRMGVTPISSYNSRGSSITSHIWLDWIEKTREISLAREYCVYGVYYADGVHVESRTVFEFLGCFWHGCRCCYDQDATNPKHGVPYSVLNAAVAEKRRYYTKHGFKCEFMWECDFKHMKRQDPILTQFYRERKEYYSSIDTVGPIQLRDALKGGRTNNIKFLHETSDEESIRYLDVCSLYPAVLKHQKYPLGHPTKITYNFDMTLQSYFGYVQCSVDPPAKLRFGVLPITINGKLTFPLCMVCAETQTSSFCSHTSEQRRMFGTWTTIELHHALNCGYRLHKIYTVLHWPESTDRLFTQYIDTWLKHKIQASGFPEGVETLGDRLEYIREYELREGVQLDLDMMVYNPGLRTLAKLMLNSLWGKLAQRTNLPTTDLVTNQSDMRKILLDSDKIVDSLYCPTENHMIINWRWACDEQSRAGLTNLAVAGFVTAYGRVTLLRHLEGVERVRVGRVLYFDTDSVIFVERPGDPAVPTGSFLGDLTDEIPSGWKCDTFACGGPKNYLLRIRKNDETKIILRAKGLVLTSEASQIVNIDSVVEMCRKFIQGEIVEYKVPQFRIHSDYKTGHVNSCYNTKKYRVSSDKRLRLPGDNDTWPYGYIDCINCGTSLTCDCQLSG